MERAQGRVERAQGRVERALSRVERALSRAAPLRRRYVGNEKSATIKRRIVCRNCKGKANLPRCANCGPCPKEKKMIHRSAGPGRVFQQEIMVQSKER